MNLLGNSYWPCVYFLITPEMIGKYINYLLNYSIFSISKNMKKLLFLKNSSFVNYEKPQSEVVSLKVTGLITSQTKYSLALCHSLALSIICTYISLRKHY